MEGRRLNYLLRQRSLNYQLSRQDSEDGISIPMCSRGRKSVDKKDSSDFENNCCLKDKNRSAQIKLLAIYDDANAIMKILKSEGNPESVQRLLSMQDERGQPCIFYALESRSNKALACLLDHSKNADCVITANGESLLHVATRMGEVCLLRCLLDRDLFRNLVDHVDQEHGRTPLHIAAKYNHIEVAKELLLHGAKLDRQDTAGNTPIFMAASKGHALMLKVFLQHGGKSVEKLMLDSSLYGPLHETLLQVAVDSGDEKTVQVCLDQDSDVVRKCLQEEIKHGQGVLIHSACENGMEQCLLKIVESMGDLEKVHLHRKDNLGCAPIHKAAMNNHARLVKYLSSISRSFVNQTTEYSQTALVLAAQRGHVEIVEELLNLKVDFRIADDGGRTVLHYGVNFPDVLTILLQKKGLAQLLVNAKEKDGFTPVHFAALRGLYESLKVLLEYGGDLNVFNNTSRSPLHCAVSSQCVHVVQLVLSNERELVNKADATGKTPLHTAASYCSAEVVRCLLDCGALAVRDENLQSALHIAAYKGHLDVVESLVAFDRNIIDWKNKYGRTALIAAASTGKTDVVKFLLENGAEINEDYEFLNCLDWSLIKNDKDTAMVMMRHSRWKQILMTGLHGAEATMAKLVHKMPEVACRVLSNSVTSKGHPDSKEYVRSYDFSSLQDCSPDVRKHCKVKPLTAIETMVRTKRYSCLRHPVCRKFLKAKWMDFGWTAHTVNLLLYTVFLVSLNVYAFQIPSYQKTQANPGLDNGASIGVKVSMLVCLIFTGFQALKEIVQLIFFRHLYFLDSVNYLEWVLYTCVFIFAIPRDGKIAVKTSLQWKACSVALLLSWINFVLYLRRFCSFGIYVLMMKKICVTLVKVLSLLIFFFVAFAAAFTPIMNDKQGFGNFGVSLLTSGVMTMGEFDFKETFLDQTSQEYDTFLWLRLALLVAFVFLMPVILMNFLLALAIGDTNSIMRQAELRTLFQTAKLVINLERKRSTFPWCTTPRPLSVLEERPNERVHILRTIWENLFYGPDQVSSDEDTAVPRDNRRANDNVEDKLVMIVDMMKEMQQQISVIQEKILVDEENRASSHENRDTREPFGIAKERRNAWTQFRGQSVSFKDKLSDAKSLERRDVSTQFCGRNGGYVEMPFFPKNSGGYSKRNSWPQFRRKSGSFHQNVLENDVYGGNAIDDTFTAGRDLKDEKDNEEEENDPELVELKELHKKTPMEEYANVFVDDDDGDPRYDLDKDG